MPTTTDTQQTASALGYNIEIRELGPEGDDGRRIEANAFEILEIQGEQRLVKLTSDAFSRFEWTATEAEIVPLGARAEQAILRPLSETQNGASAQASLVLRPGEPPVAHSDVFFPKPRPQEGDPSVPALPTPAEQPASPIQLTRTHQQGTRDVVLWSVIRHSTERIRFPAYARFIDFVLGGNDSSLPDRAALQTTPEQQRVLEREYEQARNMAGQRLGRTLSRRPLTGIDAYKVLREATDWFLKIHVGVLPTDDGFARLENQLGTAPRALGPGAPRSTAQRELDDAWNAYTVTVDRVQTLPYLKIVRDRLAEYPLSSMDRSASIIETTGILRDKLINPCFVELIWSYWMEEGMLVQTMHAVAARFQNKSSRLGTREPLANLEMDHLRPLNNLFWGYVQDELNRLSVARRAHEYEHEYGLRLEGRAVHPFRPADRRSKFLEAFHNLLHRCLRFYQQDDDTTVVADGFPVLNAIKEVHYLLAFGAHNQFGDLPSTARAEMLVQQWLLARPEMRDFLGGRVAVPYPEPWMDRVDAMKAIQGWTDTSVVHFNDLAIFGEQIVLGLRYGGWSLINDSAPAANFARVWRAEIQGYVHAYRAVTGVDLGATVTTQQAVSERDLPPSVHLKRRLSTRQAVR